MDLRLDQTKGEPASERLKHVTRDEFEGMLIENSDEPYAAEIASVVMQELKKGHPVDTTSKLRELIEKALVQSTGCRSERGSEEILCQNISGAAY